MGVESGLGVLVWLVVPALVTLAAAGWLAWHGRDRRAPGARESVEQSRAALRRMREALERPPPSGRARVQGRDR